MSRSSLLTIYKSFVRPHLDCGDVIYDQPNNNRLLEKIECIQYNAALAMTGAIRETSREKLYHELGLNIWKTEDGWDDFVICKVLFTKLPAYLCELIPPIIHSHCNPDC